MLERILVAAAVAVFIPSTPASAQQRRMGPAITPQPVEAPVRVPFRMVRGRPVIEVTIDGKGPYPFIVDTGAMASLASADLVAELGLPAIGRAMVGDPSGGAPTTVDVYQAGELTLAGAPFRSIRLIGLGDPGLFASLGGAKGILSVNALAGNVVELDFSSGTLAMSPGQLADGDGSMPYAGDLPIPSLDIDVAGHVVRADLDTGNGRGIALPSALRDSLQLAGEPVADTLHMLTGAYEAWSATLAGTVTVGGNAVANPRVSFQDVFPQATVGPEVLAGMRLLVDPLNRRYWVGRGPAPIPGEPAAAQTAADSAAVRATALDYIGGWFEHDPARMRRALHPGLVKEIQGADGSVQRMGADELVAMVERMDRASGRATAPPGLAEATRILAIFGDAASVRIDAPDWVDLLHLVRADGEWKILQVLWELR